MTHAVGTCPECGSADDLTYDDAEGQLEVNCIYYKCKCEACGWVGKEYYSMTFIEYITVSKGEKQK